MKWSVLGFIALCVVCFSTMIIINSSKQYYQPLSNLDKETFTFNHKGTRGSVSLKNNRVTFKYTVKEKKESNGGKYTTIKLNKGFNAITLLTSFEDKKQLEKEIEQVIKKKNNYEYKVLLRLRPSSN